MEGCRKILLDKEKWGNVIIDMEVYTDEIIIHIKKTEAIKTASNILNEILGKSYDDERKRILLDLSSEYMNVTFETEECEEKLSVATPLFKNVLYQKIAYYTELIEKELPVVIMQRWY